MFFGDPLQFFHYTYLTSNHASVFYITPIVLFDRMFGCAQFFFAPPQVSVLVCSSKTSKLCTCDDTSHHVQLCFAQTTYGGVFFVLVKPVNCVPVVTHSAELSSAFLPL